MHESEAREVVVIAPIRSGKTRSLIHDICRQSWNNASGFGTLVCAPTYRDLYVLLEKPTLDKLTSYGLLAKDGHNWTLHETRLRNGNTIYWRSANEPDKLRGLNVSECYFDEMTLCDKEAVDIARGRLLLTNGQLKMVGTPKGTASWVYRDYFSPEASLGDTEIIRYEITDNPLITSEAIDRLKAKYDPLLFRQEVMAEWVNLTESRVYYSFAEANVRPCKKLAGYPVYVGLDYNIGVNAYVVFQQPSSRELLVVAEGYGAKTTQDLAARILAEWGAQVTIIDDASGNTRQQGDGKTNRQLLAQAGLANITSYTRNPVRLNRYANTNAHFCNGLGNRRLFIDPSCKRLISELNTLCYKPGRDEPDTQGGVAGHISDALGYGVWWISGGGAAWEERKVA
jgi:phage terminase large subunit